jgi:peptidoglycan/LPS O-acetylase OafA/YrhL
MCRGWCGGRLPKFGMHPLALLTILCGFLGYPAGNPFLYAAVFTVAVQPLMVWVGACSTAAGFTARLMAWLGKVSYGVYVLHFPITLWEAGFTGWLGKFHPHLAARIDGLAVLYVLPLSLVAAHVLTVQLDAPLRKFLSARFDAQLKKAKPEAVLFL